MATETQSRRLEIVFSTIEGSCILARSHSQRSASGDVATSSKQALLAPGITMNHSNHHRPS